ncbi:MAG TPA: SPOR domain-containing protein [Gemmatimonadales bacterium]|nr:SPOR domain-containing protein [Gemmatimonadales bacterium]
MKLHTTIGGCGLAVLAFACGREPERLSLDKVPAASRAPAASSVLRFANEGGPARLYRVPSLEPSAWKAEDKLPPVERVIGADPEQGLVFTLDGKRNLVTLDLETRRVRTYLEQVRNAAMGPDGALYAIDTGSTVTQMVRRTPIRFRSKLQGNPRQVYATMTGALLARVGDKAPVLEVLGSDQAPVSTTLPSEQMAASFYGDLIAVATDTGVILYQTQGKNAPKSIRLSGHPKAVLFSPSGHRLYVAQEDDELLILDRFSGEQLAAIDLPGPAKGLRGDRFGEWLLVQPASGDSAWVIDVGHSRFGGTVSARWASDLPAVASPNALLVRRGADVAALDLAQKDFAEVGRVRDGAADEWLPIAWRPARDAESDVTTDSSALATADSGKGGASVYLQVSSSQNPVWASELADKLRAAGLPASVLAPTRSDEAHRVVLGPYATREQAEETGRKIGMPSFIVSGQDAPAR